MSRALPGVLPRRQALFILFSFLHPSSATHASVAGPMRLLCQGTDDGWGDASDTSSWATDS